MLKDKLQGKKIILGSASPRRQQFFKDLGLDYEVRLKSIEEVYPKELKRREISNYLAVLKAKPFKNNLNNNEILITADTVVWHKEQSLAKANNGPEAYKMLQTLSNDWHEVITSVCFTTHNNQKIASHSTKVKFKSLDDDEIWFYINTCKPFDKAGAYGIQEWIGLIGIEEIQGSYTNVVGLPTHLVYKMLIEMASL